MVNSLTAPSSPADGRPVAICACRPQSGCPRGAASTRGSPPYARSDTTSDFAHSAHYEKRPQTFRKTPEGIIMLCPLQPTAARFCGCSPTTAPIRCGMKRGWLTSTDSKCQTDFAVSCVGGLKSGRSSWVSGHRATPSLTNPDTGLGMRRDSGWLNGFKPSWGTPTRSNIGGGRRRRSVRNCRSEDGTSDIAAEGECRVAQGEGASRHFGCHGGPYCSQSWSRRGPSTGLASNAPSDPWNLPCSKSATKYHSGP